MTTCPVCGNQVPEGEYCGACGAHHATSSTGRAWAFAAEPTQHILQPNIVSTLFPHLPHRKSTPFRLALLGIAVLLIAVGILRLTGPAIAIAAASVPLLYVLYLYEVGVYEKEPFLIIGLTFGLGVLLGIPWAIVTGPLVTQALLHDMTAGVSPSNLLIAGALLPLAAQALMLAGALVLFVRGRHREPLDGFTFGAAGALGFTLATTVVNLIPELQRGLVGGEPATTNVLTVLGQGLLVPFLNASTTGLIAGALWLTRRPSRTLPLAWTTSLPMSIAVAATVRIILGVTEILVIRPGIVMVIYLVVAAILLLWVRVALHSMLLAEAPKTATGPEVPCPNCRHVAPRMAFCPHCGISMQATPRTDVKQPEPGVEALPAGGAEIEGTRGARHPVRRWGALAGTVLAGAVALAVVAVLAAPAKQHACGPTCTSPPPPCVGFCRHFSLAPPLRTGSTYTSGSYGYSVDYTQFAPSHQDSSSIGWDLSSGFGQYSVEVTAGRAAGRGADEIVQNIIDNNFPDYSLVYAIPGAEVGYTPGAGAVYDDEVVPFFGQASDTRLVVLTAVKSGLAVAVIADGDASTGQSDHPDPSGLPVSGFADSLANGTRWPGTPPR